MEEDAEKSTYKPAKKKLSTEEITALKEEQDSFKTELIKKFISDTINAQNNLFKRSTGSKITSISEETTDLLTKIFGSVEDAYDSDLPQICKDTCTEVMRRFDELQGSTGNAAKEVIDDQ